MKNYTIVRTYQTGVCKPHTIELAGGRKISVVYYEKQYIELPETATATAKDGATYRIFESSDRERALAIKKVVKE